MTHLIDGKHIMKGVVAKVDLMLCSELLNIICPFDSDASLTFVHFEGTNVLWMRLRLSDLDVTSLKIRTKMR